jgi:hypothetical protein
MIVIPLKSVEVHPGRVPVHEASRIFEPMIDKTLIQHIFGDTGESILKNIKRLNSSFVTRKMDAGTILRHHFLEDVVNSSGLRPFFFRVEFHKKFGKVDHYTITTPIVEELLEKTSLLLGLSQIICFASKPGHAEWQNQRKILGSKNFSFFTC